MDKRIVNMVKLKVLDKDTVYIGRSHAHPFHYGNPFSHLPNTLASVKVETREEAIEAFEQWIRGKKYKDVEPERRKWILKNLGKLKGKKLACWCAPKPCHGEVYLKLLEEKEQ